MDSISEKYLKTVDKAYKNTSYRMKKAVATTTVAPILAAMIAYTSLKRMFK